MTELKKKEEAKLWVSFYHEIEKLYGKIDFENCYKLYSNKLSPFSKSRSTNKRIIANDYRAVIQLQELYPIKSIDNDIKNIISIYRSIKGDDKPLPQYIPRLLKNKHLTKIQIHVNIAHSSINYKPGEQDLIPIARYSNQLDYKAKNDPLSKKELEKVIDMVSDLKKSGYSPELQDLITHTEVVVPTEILCKKFNCESVQHRIKSGQQIRANFFDLVDGELTKSRLSSLGVLLIPYEQKVEVLKSHKRKRRSDALYGKRTDEEIVIHEIPNSLKLGQLYRR